MKVDTCLITEACIVDYCDKGRADINADCLIDIIRTVVAGNGDSRTPTANEDSVTVVMNVVVDYEPICHIL